MKTYLVVRIAVCVIAWTIVSSFSPADDLSGSGENFHRDKLVAWCIVPFDAKQRGPEARAEMVRGLGLTRVAYDWRDVHVPTFEEEILQYKKHNIEFFAFWGWHDSFEPLIEKYGIHPQIWMMFSAPVEGTQKEKVKAAAEGLLPLVEKTRRHGLKLALYNHGGWSGEPQNMIAVCEYLRNHHDAAHVGIVYNLHHAHEHIADFAEQFKILQPYLLCMNLNGMNDGAQPKILPIGDGKHDVEMIGLIRNSGYSGPIGILDHREQLDSEESLKQNLVGLKAVLEKLGDAVSAATYE
ncbi:MAG TPA: TIM barrel protein [Planctomycetaceae bacterium]|nr:TIM barrel protein [Planctomycetaceae bacterium]